MKNTLILLFSLVICYSANAQTPSPQVITEPGVYPQYPGGEAAMNNFLKNIIIYPQLAKDCNCQGKVIAQYIVMEDGSIDSIKIIKKPFCEGTIFYDDKYNVLPNGKGAASSTDCIGASTDLEKEVIHILKAMPKWQPGSINGKPVKVLMTLPINFRMD